jgi:uncharacterized membrane protein YccC
MALRDLGTLLSSAFRLDRSQSDPLVALRNAVGIAAPLIIAAATGSVSAGLPSTIGALQTGLADRPGPYRLRALRMVGTAFAAAVTSGLAVLCSRSDVASVVLLLVLAFGAGLLVTGGPSATQVGVAATAAAIILGHLPEPPSAAVHVGLLVVVGGAGQALLAVAAWPLGRHAPERTALAGLYTDLAAEAHRPAGPGAAPAATATVGAVRGTLYGLGHDHGPSVEAYRVLLDEAERIRREVAATTALVERLAGAGASVDAGLARAALRSVGDVLAAVAAALTAGRPVPDQRLEPTRQAINQALARLDAADDLTRRAAAARLRALAGQLRAVVESTATGAAEGGRPEPSDMRGAPRLRDPIAALRANLTPDSEVWRHAVRTAVMVAGSDLVVRLAGFAHGYWVSLTLLVVLRPDFSSTFQRAVLRVLGTVIGLVLATELLRWIPGGTWYLIALVALAYFGVRLAGPGNVGLTAVSLSALVVVLLALNGVAPVQTLVDRSTATLVGGVLALLAALLLPVWERDRISARLADLVAAYRRYLDVLADPEASPTDRQRARAGSRLARTNALASLDRARAEPVVARTEVDLAEGVLANSHRVVHALMTMDTVRSAAHETAGLRDFLHACSQALAECERAVRDATAPRAIPRLRELQERVFLELQADKDTEPETVAALADATDRLANGIDTLAVGLRRRLGANSSQAGSTVAP